MPGCAIQVLCTPTRFSGCATAHPAHPFPQPLLRCIVHVQCMWKCFERIIFSRPWGANGTSPSASNSRLYLGFILIRNRLRGAPKGRARGPGPSPWDLKSTRFSVFLPLNYVTFVLATRILIFLLFGRTEEACSLVKSLHKVYFSHPTGLYLWKFTLGPSPWGNPGCAPV